MNYGYIGPEGQIKYPERSERNLSPELSNTAPIADLSSLLCLMKKVIILDQYQLNLFFYNGYHKIQLIM